MFIFSIGLKIMLSKKFSQISQCVIDARGNLKLKESSSTTNCIDTVCTYKTYYDPLIDDEKGTRS